MCCDYELVPYRVELSAGSEDRGSWAINAAEHARSVPKSISLEEEIHLLRSKMEQIFMQEQSFTSDIVIEISSLLDLKINEYMKIQPKKK